MELSAEEKLMYDVMKALYNSGIPISFKGAMVMKACLLEAGYSEDTRHTVDIDADWNSDNPPSAEQLVESLQRAITANGIELEVSIYRMYGERRSAGLELKDHSTQETIFTMDIDVNRPVPPTRIYEVEGFCFRGVTPGKMIADKLAVISTDAVFRRIKDIVDLYYISKVFEFDYPVVTSALETCERSLGNFDGFLNNTSRLKHAYEKFRFNGEVYKPPFDEIYESVKEYIKDILPNE